MLIEIGLGAAASLAAAVLFVQLGYHGNDKKALDFRSKEPAAETIRGAQAETPLTPEQRLKELLLSEAKNRFGPAVDNDPTLRRRIDVIVENRARAIARTLHGDRGEWEQ